MSKTTTRVNIATMTKIGALSALAVALMFAEFPIFSLYPWLKMDFADVPALLGGFALGPVAGCIIEFIKVFFSFILKNSGTGGVGELANLLLGIAFVFPAAYIYKSNKSRKRAILGLSLGAITMVVLAPILNYFVLIPIYIQFLPQDFNVGLYIATGAVPLTAIKAVAESILVIFLYKHLSGILHKQLQ